MPCYSCSAEFGLLKKEVGCEICGFSFCSRCCKTRDLPNDSSESKKQAVCNNCYKHLTDGDTRPPARGSPPLAHKKRMEALKKQSFSMDSESHARIKSQWSNEKDKALAERLQRLKRDRIKDDLPSEGEIEERLAKLKGMDPAMYTAPPIQVFRPAEKRTSIDQASDLMKQITEEVAIDSQRVKPEDEIAARLANLRDELPKNAEERDIESAYSTQQKESLSLSKLACKEVKELNSDVEYKKLLSSMQQDKETDITNEEEEADRLVEKLLATNIEEDMEALDSLNGQDSSEKSSAMTPKGLSAEEFPWCIICTEDAKIRCFGCDEDLYCLRCFRECHDSLDIQDHKTCPFLPPKTPLM